MSSQLEPVLIPSSEDFDETFGHLLENMLDLFPVEELDQLQQQDQGNGGDTDVERVLSCEKRVKDWRVGTKELVDRARDDLRGIALDYKSALTSSTRSSTVPSATEHQRVLENMFQSTVTTMKHNSELDQQVMELQGELGRLVEEVKEEEAEQIEVNGLNSEVLRLKLYRDLGFTPLPPDSKDNGKYKKFLVRSAHSAEARVVELDPNVQDFQWCNFLWGIVDGRAPPGSLA